MQLAFGVELGVNLGARTSPFTVGAFNLFDLALGNADAAPSVGVWTRAQLGARAYRALSTGVRAGVVWDPDGDGPAFSTDDGGLSGELGLCWGGLDEVGGPAHAPALQVGVAGYHGFFLHGRYTHVLDIAAGGTTRMVTLAGGVGVPAIPVMQSTPGRPLRTPTGRVVPRVAGPPSPWRDAAAEEGSAVGAFVRLAAELQALDAPPTLVGRALDAACDELRHVALCAREGRLAVGPLPLLPARPGPRDLRLARIAVEGLLDGVDNEGRAAADAERAGDEVRASIARDERRHAQLGGDLAAWAAKEGGRLGRTALRRAERALAG